MYPQKNGGIGKIQKSTWKIMGCVLAEVSTLVRDAIMEVMRVCLSQKGYKKTQNVMRLNGFLGDLLGGPDIFGEFTYIFNLFGTPSTKEPWGWQVLGITFV